MLSSQKITNLGDFNSVTDFQFNYTLDHELTRFKMWLLGNGELGVDNLLNRKIIFRSGTSFKRRILKTVSPQNQESVCPAFSVDYFV